MTLDEAILQSGLPRRDAQTLAAAALGVSQVGIVTGGARPLSDAEQARLVRLFDRRRHGEPLAYLVGLREFFSLEFEVGPAVLIPRPETELLVEFTLEHTAVNAPCRVLDLGTGSGCIAVAIATQRPSAAVTASDVSSDALAVAASNAKRHGAGNVELVRSDWFAGLGDRRFHVVVANPPYVAAGDLHLAQGDLRYEPQSALVAGPDGLECVRLIIGRATAHLERGGWLAVEHGYDQADACRSLLREAGYSGVFSRRDLAGIERMSGGRLGGGS